MVVFRPFVGEVLKGRIVSCTEEHIRGAFIGFVGGDRVAGASSRDYV